MKRFLFALAALLLPLTMLGVEVPAGNSGGLEVDLTLTDKTAKVQTVFMIYSSKGDVFNLQYRKNRLQAAFYDRSAKKWYHTAKVRPLPENKPCKVQMSWELPGKITLNVNGKPAGEVDVDVAPDFAKNSKVFIGSNQVGGDKFSGTIKDFRFVPFGKTSGPAAAAPAKVAAADKGSIAAEYVFELTIDEPLKDLSGNGFHPLNTPGESSFVKGELDAVRFAADGDGIQLPGKVFPGAAGALDAVVNLERKSVGSESGTLFSVYSPKGDVFNVVFRKNRLLLAYYDRSAKKWYDSKPALVLPVGKFVRVTLTWQFPGTAVLSVDGKKVAKADVDAAPSFAANSVVFIGSNFQKKAVFPGLIHSVKLYRTPQIPVVEKKKVKKADALVTHRIGDMSIGFEKNTLQLRSWIYNGVEYFSRLHDAFAWEMRVRDVKTGKYTNVFPDSAGKTEYRLGKDEITFIWRQVRLPDGSSVDVSGTVTAVAGNKLNWQFRSGVLPEAYTVDSVTYPRLPCAPTAENPRDMFICYPKYYGINIPDAFSFKTGRGRRYGSTYPGGAHYQFAYLYGKNVPGIYLHPADSAGNYKEFGFHSFPQQKTMVMQLLQTPPQRAISRQFVSQYPVYTAIISGDWYDAAKVYREWAVKQHWSAKGTLDKRKDMPRWVFDTHIATRPSTQTKDMADLENGKARVAINRSNFRIIRDELRCGGLAVWYSYRYVEPGNNSVFHGCAKYNGRPEMKIIPGIDEAVKEFKSGGIYTIGYLNSRIYDESTTPGHADTKAVEPLVMRDLNGEFQRYANGPFDVCRGARGWQERLLEIIRHDSLANGFVGMYLDSFGRGQHHCWATNHGHLPGCSTASVTGQRTMAKFIKEEMNKVIPGFVIVSEANIEQFIDVIDFKLHHENIYEHAVPVWTKIYHDRQFVYGRNTDPARVSVTSCFHIGALLGRIFTGNSDENLRQRYLAPEVIGYYRQLIAMRKRFYAQIGVGEMLRPPQVGCDVAPLVEKIGKMRIEYPAVTASAWRSSDGVPCVFFTNASAQNARFTFALDRKDLPGTPKNWVIADNEGKLRTIPYDGKNSFELAPLCVAALEF